MNFVKAIFISIVMLHQIVSAENPPQSCPKSGGGGIFEFGGLGGPLFRVQNMGTGFLFEMGGRGGLTIANLFMLGGGGYGVVGHTGLSLNDKDEKISLGYGGVGFGFKIFPSAFIHISNFNMFGMGRLGLLNSQQSGTVYTIEPELDVEFSFISFLRLGLGASYRYMIAPSLSVPSSQLSGFGGQIYFEFGWL